MHLYALTLTLPNTLDVHLQSLHSHLSKKPFSDSQIHENNQTQTKRERLFNTAPESDVNFTVYIYHYESDFERVTMYTV